MLISRNWLQAMVDISDITAQQISDTLTSRGIEVEGIASHPIYTDKIVAARLAHIEEHPNSDHLHIVQVDYGAPETIQVVCGAPGIQEGWIVPFAQIGASFGDFVIKKSKLRGVLSYGMLCSEREIGISEEHGTLMRLPMDAKPGTPLAVLLGLDTPSDQVPFHETIFEISLTPDRGDCLSVRGIARELSAALHRELKSPAISELCEPNTQSLVTIESPEDCPRYCGLVLDGIQVKESPAWLRRAVEACGARSINNVVDVTNYVCFELGHPLHAFDLEKLAGKCVQVRRARDGEQLEAINHEKYSLNTQNIVIADQNTPLAIAGVMGGAPTEVSGSTQAILLEAASFNPTLVRKTAKKLGLHSESSHRFERFVDSNSVSFAIARALYLLREAQEQPISVVSYQDNTAKKLDPIHVSLRVARVNAILGTSLKADEIVSLLEPIGLKCKETENNVFDVTVPTFRNDIRREIDIIEEICRGYGFDRIEATLPLVSLRSTHNIREEIQNPTIYPVNKTLWTYKEREREHTLRRTLIDCGLNECMHYTFMEPEDPANLGFDKNAPEADPMHVANPLAVEQSCMRTTLVPSMLRALKVNTSRQQKSVAHFELGSVFFQNKHEKFISLDETQNLCILLWGETPKRWNAPSRAWDIYDLKGIIERLNAEMRWNLTFNTNSESVPYLHPGIQASLEVNGKTYGFLGELHPSVAEAFKIEGAVFVATLKVSELQNLPIDGLHFEPLPKFPCSTRDHAFVIASDVTFAQIAQAVEQNRPEILESWDLFDVYKGKQIKEGLQSIALSFVYRDPHATDAKEGRTLTDDEIQTSHNSLVNAIQTALNAQAR